MTKTEIFTGFRIPLAILLGICLALAFMAFGFSLIADGILISVTLLGSYELYKEIVVSMVKGKFALDYIAVLAITVSVLTHEYLVAAVLSLMIASGKTLEDYGASQAKVSLTKLAERIPREVLLWKDGSAGEKEKIENIEVGQEILVRRGEVFGLDGTLESSEALIDESSLTGEPYPVEKIKGDFLRSGTINVGDSVILRATKTEKNSVYEKIIEMVRRDQQEKAPLVRLADRYSVVFTIVTLMISLFAYFISRDFKHVLAVLVIATPCPLLLATPIALLGGVNASAKKRIIVKKLAGLEALSRISAIIFDKTGTITLGKPSIAAFKNFSRQSDTELLAIAEGIERNSLHPLAKAIVSFAKERQVPLVQVSSVQEQIGSGISGVVEGRPYTLKKLKQSEGMTIGLHQEQDLLATFQFEDELKQDSKRIISLLNNQGLELYIFTGDKREAAEKVARQLGARVHIQAECTPEDKQKGIADLKKKGMITAMVGDGINDAPALALADVGMVFSNEEQTAASEAADVVFLGGDFSLVIEAIALAKRSVGIALQSIWVGIGASILGMVFAAFGYIPPVMGALIQEGIDVVVILNALRASR